MAEETTSSPAAAAPVSISIETATRASDSTAVPEILQDIQTFGDLPSVQDGNSRLELLAKARELVRALETPRETMIKHCWAQPACFAALTAGCNLGVFQIMANGGGRGISVQELASAVGTNVHMLTRFMKHIAAMGYIKETGADEYAPTSFSNALTIPIIGDGYRCCADGILAAVLHLPAYMAQTQYATPTDVQAGPFQSAFRTQLNMFEYLTANSPLGQQFNHHMGGYRQGRPSWMDNGFYPVEERLVQGMEDSPDAVVLVDIGGNLGHDLLELLTKYPNLPGRLILQDLPNIITAITSLTPKIERMPYDFHTPQPVKGARAYYLHSVLHDWPDEVCVDILKQVVGGMKRGYSKLLINENIIPSQGADWQATGLDILMASLLSSKERTEEDWYALIEGSGLGMKISGIWSMKGSQESLIECELA